MNCQDIFRFDTPLEFSSPYYLGYDIAERFPDQLEQHDFDRVFLVTTKELWRLFGDRLDREIRNSGYQCQPIWISASERNKGWRLLRTLCNEVVRCGATKDSILIALGGGVIGNVAGLASALIFRGLRYIEVPTTIMAQTDSTLSNKQAINGPRGKNHFGVYHAPLFIWSDAAYSQAEPRRQQRSGVVEGIKNIFISHRNLDALDPLLDAWNSAAPNAELVRMLIDLKLQILRRDPTERGYCVVLEYGHTFGHAIEWLARGRLFHGEAVSIGMCIAAALSHSLGFLPETVLADHYRSLRDGLGAPTQIPADIDPRAILRTMHTDNKRTRRGLRYLLLENYGQFVNPCGDYMVGVDDHRVLNALCRAVAIPTEAEVT